MSVRVSPYLLSLIDWTQPVRGSAAACSSSRSARACCPITRKLDLDSLHERADMPVPGLTHRYVDKALFLALDTCPVYCRFCTRSYAVGIDTEEVAKFQLKVNAERWQQTFDYIRSRPELEDIVISGGDAYQLRAEQITQIGETLLGDRPRPPHALRDQGAGGHAAEDPDRRRLDRRAHRRRRARAQAAQGGGAPHPLQPPARDHRDHPGGHGQAVRARHHRAQPDGAAAAA